MLDGARRAARTRKRVSSRDVTHVVFVLGEVATALTLPFGHYHPGRVRANERRVRLQRRDDDDPAAFSHATSAAPCRCNDLPSAAAHLPENYVPSWLTRVSAPLRPASPLRARLVNSRSASSSSCSMQDASSPGSSRSRD